MEVYADEDKFILTNGAFGCKLKTIQRLLELLRETERIPTSEEDRILFAIESESIPYYSAGVFGGYKPYEALDEQKEVVRHSVVAALMALGIWLFQHLVDKKNLTKVPVIDLYPIEDETCEMEDCSQLQESYSNLMATSGFAQSEIEVDKWTQLQLMRAKRSCEQAFLMEVSSFDTTAEERLEIPFVLDKQGITVDHKYGDWTGAAVSSELALPLDCHGADTIGWDSFHSAYEKGMHMGDALHHAHNFSPKFAMDIGAMSDYLRKSLDDEGWSVINSKDWWPQITPAITHTVNRDNFPSWTRGTSREERFLELFRNMRVDAHRCHPHKKANGTQVQLKQTNGTHFNHLCKRIAMPGINTMIQLISQTICNYDTPQFLKEDI